METALPDSLDGPIRAAVLLGILQIPHRFRTKRQLWTYSGLGIEVHSSADHQTVNGQLQRKKKHVEVRGLNRNYNHDLKNLFKGAASRPRQSPDPSGILRVTAGQRHAAGNGAADLGPQIAAIVLIVWKRGVCFDAKHLKPQTA